MRFDLLFKNLLIFRRRDVAKTLCQSDLIRVNGHNTKASKQIHKGDIVEIETPYGTRKIKVLKIPKGNICKQDKDLFYEELSP
ncbi:MAG: hypothetical protein WBB37_04345 [bacterium]